MSSTGPRTGGVPVAARRRRVLTDDAADRGPQFFTSAIDGAPRWATGALAAVQAAVLSLLTLVLPAVAAFVATSADPTNSDVSWLRAVGVGASVWLLGHGVPAVVGGVHVTLVPLGVTVLAVFACAVSARRSGVVSRLGLGAGVVAYVLVVLLVALLAGVGGAGLLRAVVGGACVSTLGLGSGLMRRPDAPPWSRVLRPLRERLPAPVRVGVVAGVLATATLLTVSAVLATLWVVAGRATVGDVVRGLAPDAVGGVVLAVGELGYVPNLVVWALAWLAGPGFAVGAGTRFAPDAVVTAPLPAVPMLGALPAGDQALGTPWITPLLVAAVGALAGWLVHRRTHGGPWWASLAAVGVLAGTAGTLVAVLVTLASGGIGPGRMADVGAQGGLVGLAVATATGLGAAVLALPADPALRRRVARALRRGRGRDDAPGERRGD